jgi:hypothetical protein
LECRTKIMFRELFAGVRLNPARAANLMVSAGVIPGG